MTLKSQIVTKISTLSPSDTHESPEDSAGHFEEEKTCRPFQLIWKGLEKLIAVYLANDFAVNVLLAIAFAKAYPPLGAEYVVPKITVRCP